MQIQLFNELQAAHPHTPNAATDAHGAPKPAQSIFEKPEDRLFMISLLLHSADISNPLKPTQISDKCVQALATHDGRLAGAFSIGDNTVLLLQESGMALVAKFCMIPIGCTCKMHSL